MLFKPARESVFYWKGISQGGELRSGHVHAKNKRSARMKLRAQDVIVKTITHKYYWSTSLKPRDITAMFSQLATLISSELSLIQAIHILIPCQSHSKMTSLLTRIQLDLEAGSSFSEALQRHPNYFDRLVCSLVTLGEEAGTLMIMMARIAEHLAGKEHLKEQLKTIVSYPLMVLLVAAIVTIHLLTTVVPQFEVLFHGFQAQLPWMTRAMVALSFWIKAYGGVSLCLGIGLLMLVHRMYHRYKSVRIVFDRFVLTIPSVGRLCQHLYLARSFQALSLSHQAGLPFVDALQWVAQVAGNLAFTQAFLKLRTALMEGDSMRSSVYQAELFPELVVQMLSLGERSGAMQDMLMDLTRYYTRRVEHAIQRLSRLIEPMLMMILGLIVGALIIAMYVPIIKLGTLI